MTQHDPADLATRYIEAFGRGDLDAVASMLAPDVSFTSPRVSLHGARDVLAAVGEFAQAVEKVHIVDVIGDGDRAMIMYDMHTVPFGTLRAVDHLVIRDGRIAADVLVFDTGPLTQPG